MNKKVEKYCFKIYLFIYLKIIMDDIGPFVCKTIDCNISYTYGYDDYYINNIRDIVETKNTCKNITYKAAF